MQIDLSQIDAQKQAGYVGTQCHPTLPLLIHNYTQRCQFDRAWNPVTLMCRGLITDMAGTVVARPFHKFFNLDEHANPTLALPPINWQQEFYVSEKVDGSLGVLYPTPDGPAIATRGSFVSDQAKVGTAILRERYAHFRPDETGDTYLFEIIYPGNRIVVDYGDMRDLVLLDVIETATGRCYPRMHIQNIADYIGCPVVKHLELSADDLTAYETGEANREGVVVRFDDGTRVKIKLGEYKRLHRLITGLNARKIWECLSTGTELDLERVPDEFFQWVERTKGELCGQHFRLRRRAYQAFEAAKAELGDAPRKDYAARFLQTRDISGLLFSLLDEKDITAALWKMVYPEHSIPWKEADAA